MTDPAGTPETRGGDTAMADASIDGAKLTGEPTGTWTGLACPTTASRSAPTWKPPRCNACPPTAT